MYFDTNPHVLNREIARELKERKMIMPPVWTPFVKTGSHKERQPTEEDWFYHRAAAILRAVATKGPIGTSKLSVRFGSRENRGVKPDRYRRASTNIIRKCLQQLEKAGLVHQVEHAGHKGRALTKEGTTFLKGAMERARKVKA